MRTNILTIRFQNELKPHEITLFRGAIIAALDNKLTLFHNHEGDGFRFGYPLIQYKIIGGKAAIICLNQGTEQVGEFFSSNNFDVMIGERPVNLQIDRIVPRSFNIQLWDSAFNYRIRRWAPLNAENYAKYQKLNSLSERCEMLERILVANILSMSKGLGIMFEDKVECRIKKLEDPFMITSKGVKMQCFDAEFISNVSIPNFVGLGKHASINFGIVTKIPQRNSKSDKSSES